MKDAVSKDQDWYAAYRKAHVGKALPYHPRLGLNEVEYEELQNELDNGSLHPSTSVRFRIERAGTGIVLKSEGEPSRLSELEIHAEDGYVVTPYGRLFGEAAVNYSNSSLGSWTGLEWRQEALQQAMSGLSVSFLIAFSDEKRVGMMKYSADASLPDGNRENFDMIITYPLEEQEEPTELMR